MNTAFGGPELLPFDLSKKRVVTYKMPEVQQDRAPERRKLEAQLDTALRTILSNIDKQQQPQQEEKRLQETYSDLIENNQIAAWRQLIERINDEIIESLMDWKYTGEQALSQVRTGMPNWKPWKIAVHEAVTTSIPGLVPILTSIQASNEKYWGESIDLLRRLVLLYRDMGGGTTHVLKIGESILYVAGSIGMALAARNKQLNFVILWAGMTLPETEGPGETTWCQTPEINYWKTGITGHNNDPYGFVVQLLELDDIKPFFDRAERFKQSLFSGNLLHSLVDFHNCASQADYEENLKSEYWRPNVMPIWCLMEPADFKNEVWRIFASSAEVIKFAYPGVMPSAEKFWPLWKAWKKRCVQFMSDGGRYYRHLHNMYWLNLPGEPETRP